MSAGKGLFSLFGPADSSKTQSGTSESGNSACAGRIMLNDSDPLLPSSGSPFHSSQKGETVQTSNAVSGKDIEGIEDTYFLYFMWNLKLKLDYL